MPSALGIGLIGMGTVGGAVAEQLLASAGELAGRAGLPLELRGVVVRDVARGRTRLPLGELVSDDPESVLANPGVDVVVEAVGGMEPARTWIARALSDGRRVVTANKVVVAEHGRELLSLAGGRLRFEAAVMAGVPVVGALVEGMSGQRVQRIDGVLNGTSNAILEAMRAGDTYAAAVAAAQSRGYSEADPSADVDGHDAAAKLAILASLAGNSWLRPGAVVRNGIRDLRRADLRAAALTNHAVRLLATAQRTRSGWRLRVEATALARGSDPAFGGPAGGHPLAELPGVGNGVVLDGSLAGPLLLAGAGAGGEATAAAVLADLVAFARDRAGPPAPGDAAPADERWEDEDTAALLAVEMTGNRDDLDTIRLLLDDRGVGTARQDWDVESMAAGTVRAGLLTLPAPRSVITAALDTLDSDPRFEDAVSWLPVAGVW